MRLAFYIRDFPALGHPLIGGPALAVGGLMEGLLNLQQSVTILCEGATDSEYITNNGCRILSFAKSKTRIPLSITPRLRRFLTHFDERPDLIIVNGCFRPGLFVIGSLAAANGIPYVAAPHTNYHPALFQRRPYLKWPYWYLIEKQYLKKAKAIQLLDARHAQYLLRLGIHNTFFAVPNGVLSCDIPTYSDKGHKESTSIRLVFRGRLDPQCKGLDLLFLAIARLKDTYPLKVTIQGPDLGEKHKLEKLAKRLCITSIVSFLEPDYSPPYAFLLEHDIFCLPSRFEGFGISALEAMLAGRVLLVTRSAGIAPYVEESGCGVLIEPDSDSIVNGLHQLISHKSCWKEMGVAGQQCVINELNWTHIASKALIDYQKLCC